MTDSQYGKIAAFIPHKLVKNSSNVYFVQFYLISSKNGHKIVGVATVCEPTGVGLAVAEQNSYTAAATFRLQSLLTSGTTHTPIYRILWFLNRLEAEDGADCERMGIHSTSMCDSTITQFIFLYIIGSNKVNVNISCDKRFSVFL